MRKTLSAASASSRPNVLPISLPPVGLSRESAAEYIGIGTTTFDSMVADGRMPPPRVIGKRTVWDREEVHLAFKALPYRACVWPESDFDFANMK